MKREILKDLIGDWKKKKDIIKELNLDEEKERDWRKFVENFNREYQAHLTNGYYIAHSVKGYKLTKDYNEMITSDNDYYKRAMKMLKAVSRNKKARGEDMNMFFEEVIEQIKNPTATTVEQTIK